MSEELVVAIISGGISIMIALQLVILSVVMKHGQTLHTLVRDHHQNHGGDKIVI